MKKKGKTQFLSRVLYINFSDFGYDLGHTTVLYREEAYKRFFPRVFDDIF